MIRALYFLILSLICGIVTGYVHPEWTVNDYFAAGSLIVSSFLYLFGILSAYNVDKFPIYNDSIRKRIRRNMRYVRNSFAYMFFTVVLVYCLTSGNHPNPCNIFGIRISLDYFRIMMIWWGIIYFGYNWYLLYKLTKDLQKALDTGGKYNAGTQVVD